MARKSSLLGRRKKGLQNNAVAVAASADSEPKKAPTQRSTTATDDKESLNHSDSTMKVKVIGERIIVLLDPREEYGRFQVPFVGEEAITTTARPTTTTARAQEATANTTTTTELAGRFNNRIIGFDENPADAIDWGSFDISKFGILKSDEAIRQARHRARSGIVTAIKRAGNTKQQSLALHMASLHPNVRVCAKTAGFFNIEASNYHWEQMRSILKDASATGSAKGHSTDDKSLFVEWILTTIAPGSSSHLQTSFWHWH
jgi:hypothetical protein